jgi:preprotein translocase subunit YajC
VVVGTAEFDEDLRAVADDVREGDGVALVGGVGGAEAEDVGEDDLGVLAGLEGQAVEVDGEEVEQVFVDEAGD